MRLVKCKEGHIYDADKMKECPHCSGNIINLDRILDTYGENQENIPTKKTGINNTGQNSIRKSLAALVVTNGTSRGKAYIVYEGENIIGRAENLDIVLGPEPTVSPDSHAVIKSQTENNMTKLTLCPITEKYKVYKNGKRIQKSASLHNHDIIRLGECELTFVDFSDIYSM